MSIRILSAAALVLLVAACPTAPDDDDTTAPDDDDAGDVCGDPSGGFGGPTGQVWMETPGHSAGGQSSRYASFLIVPDEAPPGAGFPVLVLMARRMPDERDAVADVVADFLGFAAFSGGEGYLVAMVVPGDAGGSYSWTDTPNDEAFFRATLDELEASYDVDRDRVFLWGSSAGARAAALLGHAHADRVAAILAHAGGSPWNGDAPEPWPAEVPGLFVHGPDDDVVPRSAVDAMVEAWEHGGQRAETWFDYPHGHEWVPDTGNGPMLEFFATTCNE